MPTPETLEQAAERYFTLRRKLGYRLRSERETVISFARRMDALRRRKITLQLVVEWASSTKGSTSQAAARYEAVRRFLTVAACTRRDTVYRRLATSAGRTAGGGHTSTPTTRSPICSRPRGASRPSAGSDRGRTGRSSACCTRPGSASGKRSHWTAPTWTWTAGRCS